jgi:hypothetical protein
VLHRDIGKLFVDADVSIMPAVCSLRRRQNLPLTTPRVIRSARAVASKKTDASLGV